MTKMFDAAGEPLYLYEVRYAQRKEDWIFADNAKESYAYGKHFNTKGRFGGSRMFIVDSTPDKAYDHARRVIGRMYEPWQPAKATVERPVQVKAAVTIRGVNV